MIKVPDKEQFLDAWMQEFLGACTAQDNTLSDKVCAALDNTWSDKVRTAIDSIRHLTPSKSDFMKLERNGQLL